MKFFHSIYLSYFSQPVENRALLQTVNRLKPTIILEFGLQRAARTLNLLDLASCHRKAEEIEYTCVDPFEGRDVHDGPGLSLRKAYKLLTPFGTQLRLLPGVPAEEVKQVASLIGKVQLLVVATPGLDWVESRRNELADLLEPGGVAFLGQSPPTEKTFELHSYSLNELRGFSVSRRAAA